MEKVNGNGNGNGNGKHRILVIDKEPDFAGITEKILGDSFEVAYASSEDEGMEKARKEAPEAIVLGYLEPRGTSFELHRRLREGWITRHIPLAVVDVGTNGRRWKMEEGLQMEADDYISLPAIDPESTLKLLDSPIFKGKLDGSMGERVSAFKEAIKRENVFKEALLDKNTFCVTWEQIAGKGAVEMQQDEIIDNAAKAARSGRIHGMSVTDNPGGNPAISTEMLCTEIRKVGIEPLVHLASRDKNRNQMESMLYGLAAGDVKNLLILTGDYPSNGGFSGRSKPVFDLDPMHVLQLIDEMNDGLEYEAMGKKKYLAATDFFAGACVSPFKALESELMAQYFKLGKKIQAGAKFIITQVGYDARKYHELLQWLKLNKLDIPVMANIYVLPYGAAKLMNTNQIPGCVVTDKLVAELAEEAKAPDKGKAARLLRAAKMYAVTKGMGCAGAHIGGHGIKYEMVEEIVEKGEELLKNWESLVAEFDYPQKDGFYFFERDPQTGLNLDRVAPRPLKPSVPLIYRFSRIAHSLLFNPDNRIFKMLQPLAKRIDSSKRTKKVFGYSEHLAKVALFGCMNCGDCALFDTAYVCPMSQCPKNQRNGPCGGSYDGWCEVYPNERKCVWVRAYERLKAYKEEDKLGAYITPPCDWQLFESSSWLNFYMGRDHSAKRLGVIPPADKGEGSGTSPEKSTMVPSKAASPG